MKSNDDISKTMDLQYITGDGEDEIMLEQELELESDVEVNYDEYDDYDEEIEEKPKVGFTAEEASQVAEENTKLIHNVAKNYRHGTIPYEDIVGAGTFGYAKAISKFDKSLGYQFSTFATHCIRNEIVTFLNKERKHIDGDISMSTPLSNSDDGGTLSLSDVLSNTVEPGMDVEGKLVLAEDIQVLMRAVSMLHPRERFIIENRFELNGRKQMTQEEVGQILNRTQAGISKLEGKIMEKLKMILKGQVELESNEFYNNGRISPVKYMK